MAQSALILSSVIDGDLTKIHCKDAHVVFKAGKIKRVILMQMISLIRLAGQLIFLRREHLGLQLGCFCLIIHQAIRNQPMHFQLASCQKIQNKDGHTTKMTLACDPQLCQMENPKNFIFLKIIHNILGGLKAWNRLFESVISGQYLAVF